jgi:hypothetical protein
MDGLQGYEVYNSQIISAYGDGAIDHPTKNLVA